MDELIKAIQTFKERLESIQVSLHYDDKRARLIELQSVSADPSFWENRSRAQAVSQEIAQLERWLSFWTDINKRTGDLLSLADDDKADHAVNMKEDFELELQRLEKEVAEKEVELMFDDQHDSSPAILTIYSGAGGVDAQDWASMIERMYLRFADQAGWKTAILQRTPGQEAGIKNVTIRVAGPFAYGYLKAEAGVHRLVRLSPFDADHARHTSFAMVEVLPELEEALTITVNDDDVRVDVFRASGHGGQSVNTTDSAVRLTHTPTGITVSCQNERSQMQNKEQAWKILFGKLEKYYQAQREEERQQLRGEFTDNSWGSQIRSYVLHPYKMVKDHRTKYESKDPDAVLEGDIGLFIEAELRRQAQERLEH